MYGGYEGSLQFIPITTAQLECVRSHADECEICRTLLQVVTMAPTCTDGRSTYAIGTSWLREQWSKELEQHLNQLLSHVWSLDDITLHSVWDILLEGESRRATVRAIRSEKWLDAKDEENVNLFFSLCDYETGAPLTEKMVDVVAFMIMVGDRKIGEEVHE